MALFKVGDVVWVRLGEGSNSEEPATVVELDCRTDEGEEGVACKLHVSYFETVFAKNQVRLMPIGRPKRRTDSSSSTHLPSVAVLRKMVTPSPTLANSNKRKDAIVSNEKPNRAGKKPRVITPSLPPFGRKINNPKAKKKDPLAENSHLIVSDESDPIDTDNFAASSKNTTVKKKLGTAVKRKRLIPLKPPLGGKATKNQPDSDSIENDSDFCEDSENLDEDSDDSEEVTRPISKKVVSNKKKAPAAKRQLKTEPATDERVLDGEASGDPPLVALKKTVAKGKKAPRVKPSTTVDEESAVDPVQPDEEEESSDVDCPYKVEYSPSGRATCRRCDEIILKGVVRISHIPLFRGKPGYTIYRHLKCSVFSEEVTCAEDVGGWSKLKKEDYEDLARRVVESVEEIKKENEELDPDELVPVSFQGDLRPPPPGLEAVLLPFQVEGVSWMHHQEMRGDSGVHGGMLCDEMGMGKTIQTIVTILDNRPKLQHCLPGLKHPPGEKDLYQDEEALWAHHHKEWEHEMKMNNVPKSILPKTSGKLGKGGFRGGTLVICPVIALSQWKTEIEKFICAGALTVGIYHGPNRAKEMPREIMCKYDVILTTYQVLEADFRKMTSPNKIKCPNCGGKFKIDKLRVHLKYFCGEGAMRTEAQARQRRSSDDNGRRGVRSDSTGRGKGASSVKATTETKTFSQKRMSSVDEYDSESELSHLDPMVLTTRKNSRKASVAAKKRMSSSKKEWIVDSNDSDEFEDSGDSADDDSSDDEKKPNRRVAAIKNTLKKQAKGGTVVEDTDNSSGDDSTRPRKKVPSRKPPISKSKGKETVAKKKGMLKGEPAKRTSSINKAGAKRGKNEKDEQSDKDDSDPSDPMDGIDMDSLMKEATEGSLMSLLHSICWWRIILDEAHFIKSRSSQTASAAFALISVNRWCLSGTPLQNRVGEFYSLIRFLRIDPMAHYFCRAKDCTCKSLHYRMMNGRCQDCGHGSVQHFSHFNKHVLNPLQRAGYSGDGRRAMFTLKREILDKCLLRRTKENRAADMKLPPRLVSIRAVRLHPVEEDFYNALYTQTQSSFNDYVDQGTLLNNYAHIFDLLMRMRQAVDHPYLVVYSNKDTKIRANNSVAIAAGTADCEICNEPPTDLIISSCCEGAFCRSCVQDYMAVDRDGSIPCPGCKAPFSIDLTQASYDTSARQSNQVQNEPMPQLKELSNVPSGSILRRINLGEFATSTKIEALVEELVTMSETSPGSKAIVFSQFVNMLDLIRWRLHSDPCLKDMGLGARALHGGMDVKARDASLKDFREDPNVRVLLMSLKAGGVALNLTVANNIYLMDPWWNPAAEMQAIDRTHRLGQYRPIRAVRFIAEDTVEERILQLQEKKRLVFDGTIGRDAGSLTMLTVDDMKSLFA